MPQLDILIVSSQTFFVIFFWLGYFTFLKTILPLLSMEMKMKQKRILSHLLWYKNNLNRTIYFRLPFGKLLVKTRGLLSCIDIIVAKKNVFFGVYPIDLLFIKHRYQGK
jgi:hypothetical protein